MNKIEEIKAVERGINSLYQDIIKRNIEIPKEIRDIFHIHMNRVNRLKTQKLATR